MRYVCSVLFLFSLCIINNCSSKGEGPFPLSDAAVKAPNKITDAFKLENGASPKVSILKQALDKEFLLQAAVLPQLPVPMGKGLKSRVVAFSRQGDKLFLLEATAGHTVTKELPQELVLASFPILAETAEQITFDFNAGMSSIFVSRDWHAHDLAGKDYQPTFSFAEVRNSRLVGVEMTAENQLYIRQVAQSEEQSGFFGPTNLMTLEVRYYLSPYQPDPSFEPSREADFKRTGYFEVAPVQGTDGISRVYSSKFNMKKPIVFAISANTPADYKQAVKDGVLYWNNAVEGLKIEVVEAPAGLNAPVMTHNIVQWIPWDQAGMAYADAQMDPRTGEILHAQVYLTSTFAVHAKSEARKYIARARNVSRPIGSNAKKTEITLSGFALTSLCDYSPEEANFSASLESLLSANPSDSQVLKASQDYVRMVVAHEIGHTLGLRHNFAGSLDAKEFALKDRRIKFHEYLKSGTASLTSRPGSTVMDYMPFEEEAIFGNLIAQKAEILPYDQKAMIGLYKGVKYRFGEIPLFCTDSQVDDFVDCKRFDTGDSNVDFVTWTTLERLENLPSSLIEKFVSAKAPGQGLEPTPVEEVNLDVDVIADNILSPRSTLAGGLDGNRRILSVARSFPYVGSVNLEEVKEEERSFVWKEITRAGGLEKVFAGIPENYKEQVVAEVEEALRSETHTSGIASSGQSFQLSPDEKDVIKTAVGKLMKKLSPILAKKDLEILKGLPNDWKVTTSELGEKLAELLGKRVEQYVFSKSEGALEVTLEVPQGDDDKKDAPGDENAPKTRTLKAKLTKFSFPLEVRKAAPPVLNPGSDEWSLDWGIHERSLYKTNLLRELNAATGCGEEKSCSIDKLKTEDVKVAAVGMPEKEASKLQKDVIRWFVENKAVVDAFK